jgi:magnesium-transporting ATPase (P-type)
MSQMKQQEGLRTSSCKDLLPRNSARHQIVHLKTTSSAPASSNAGRRNNSRRASLRRISLIASEDSPVNMKQRDRIAWHTMSQHLSLQLGQIHRSKLAADRDRSIILDEKHKNTLIVPIDKTHGLNVSSGTIQDKPSHLICNTTDSALELHEDTIEETSLLKMDVHIIPLEKLTERFNTDLTNGLTTDTVTQHRATYGQNKLTPSRPPSLLWMLIKQLLIGFNGILWVATLFAFLSYVSLLYYFFFGNFDSRNCLFLKKPFGEPSPDISNVGLGVILILVIVSNALFNFYQEVKSMKIVASFSKMQPTIATVKRNGIEIQVNAEELVPGDIVRIRLGEKVPADCRLISCDDLQVNTSQLTGESAPVICTIKCTNQNVMETTNLVFYSSLVVQGAGEGIVVNIGDATVLGQIGKLTEGTGASEITGLHREINRFVLFIVLAALISIILLWITWVAWLNITEYGFITVNGKKKSTKIY